MVKTQVSTLGRSQFLHPHTVIMEAKLLVTACSNVAAADLVVSLVTVGPVRERKGRLHLYGPPFVSVFLFPQHRDNDPSPSAQPNCVLFTNRSTSNSCTKFAD